MMRRKENRIKNAIEFSKDQNYNYITRAIVGETFCKPEQPASMETIARLYKRFLKETPPGERVLR
jgi:hypothetical protein